MDGGMSQRPQRKTQKPARFMDDDEDEAPPKQAKTKGSEPKTKVAKNLKYGVKKQKSIVFQKMRKTYEPKIFQMANSNILEDRERYEKMKESNPYFPDTSSKCNVSKEEDKNKENLEMIERILTEQVNSPTQKKIALERLVQLKSQFNVSQHLMLTSTKRVELQASSIETSETLSDIGIIISSGSYTEQSSAKDATINSVKDVTRKSLAEDMINDSVEELSEKPLADDANIISLQDLLEESTKNGIDTNSLKELPEESLLVMKNVGASTAESQNTVEMNRRPVIVGTNGKVPIQLKEKVAETPALDTAMWVIIRSDNSASAKEYPIMRTYRDNAYNAQTVKAMVKNAAIGLLTPEKIKELKEITFEQAREVRKLIRLLLRRTTNGYPVLEIVNSGENFQMIGRNCKKKPSRMILLLLRTRQRKIELNVFRNC